MIDTREDEIRHLIGRLDRLVTKERAIVRFVEDDPEQGMVIHGNQLGYLRLGIEFQKAALVPLEGDEVEVDLPYLLGRKAICWEFRRREDDLPEPHGIGTAKGGFVGSMIGLAIVGFLFASCVNGAPIVANKIIGAMSGSP